MSSKQNFRLLDALKIPDDGEFTTPGPKEEPNEEDFKANIDKMSSEKLCEIIVSFRYLGLMQEESLLAMAELAARREKGDNFNFEDKITELMTSLPSINLDINKMLKSFRI